MSDSRTVIEQTDSGENHFVFRDAVMVLVDIEDVLRKIKKALKSGQDAQEALQQQAAKVLAAHLQSAGEYMSKVQLEPPPDYYPFKELPVGTVEKTLPDGNRMFTLPDGMILKTTAEHNIQVIDSGSDQIIIPAGVSVEVAPGREYEIAEAWLTATHEAAGVEGLPVSVVPVQIATGRFRIDFGSGLRMFVYKKDKLVTLINTSGTVIHLGVSSIEGIGEEVTVRILKDGSKAFNCIESGHGGTIKTDGTIYLSLKTGEDLIIHFTEISETPAPEEEVCTIQCEVRNK